MALQRAGATTTRPDGTVEEVPEGIPRGRGGRPKIRALIDGTESTTHYVTYTRASTLGKTLESDYGIQQWARRMIVHGLSRRHDLVLKAAAIPTVTEDADKKALTEVAEEALEAAKATAGGTKGTALHSLSERVDAGEDMAWLPPDAREALAAYRRLMAAVRVVASETFVVCDELEAAGTFDRVVELLADVPAPDGTTIPAGTRVVVDLKTSATADYFGPKFACQQAVYAHGLPYTHTGGRGTWPDGRAPSRRWALILHVPLETSADAGFWLVDLHEGLELAHIARTVRALSDHDGLFHPVDLAPAAPIVVPEQPAAPAPAAPPGGPTKPVPPQVAKALLIAQLRQAPDEATLTALWEQHAAVWTDDHTRMVRARLAELAAVVPA